MNRTRLVAAILCAVVMAGLLGTAAYRGAYVWAAWFALALAVCIVAALYVATREPEAG